MKGVTSWSYKPYKPLGKFHRALLLDVDTERYEETLRFEKLISFPGNFSKFMIKYDEKSGYYYSIATMAYDETCFNTRNLLSLIRSKTLDEWECVCDLFDYRKEPREKVGFQYADFEIEGDDIIFLCRTAMNNAYSFHDSNYQTFHRIKDFRKEAILE